MLNLSQKAILPGTIASFRDCKETLFNISNRAPPVGPDVAPAEMRDEFRAVLGRIGCGQVVLSRGRVIEISAIGRAILERECSLASGPDALHGAVRQLVNRAGAKIPVGSTSWLATSSKRGIAIFLDQISDARSEETSTIILLDLDAHPEPNHRTLQNMFGFTAAETRLAIELVRGQTLIDVARVRRLRRTTIRSQLASLFVKTQTRRQVELVGLLERIAILP